MRIDRWSSGLILATATLAACAGVPQERHGDAAELREVVDGLDAAIHAIRDDGHLVAADDTERHTDVDVPRRAETFTRPMSMEFAPTADRPVGTTLAASLSYHRALVEEEGAAHAEQSGDGDETGTDPRAFGAKLMPYYLYTKAQDGTTINQVNLFGMFPIEDRIAITYDLPIAKKMDVTRNSGWKSARGAAGGGEVPPGFISQPGQGGGVPFSGLDGDGDEMGMGDLGVRFFVKPKAWESDFEIGWGPRKGEQGSTSHMVGMEMTFPTATEEVLGGDALIVSPLYTFVMDTPFFGFLALMNFLDLDTFKEDEREDTTRFRGRWFLMQPLSKPGPGVLDGVYLLPEFQPVYDFEEDHFSFWVGPEVGKIISPGRIMYFKPGWGVSPDGSEGDRDWTFEFGVRIFF